MNKVILIGRLVKEPETKTTTSNKIFTRFTLAVDRNKDEADFISITCWNKTAEFVDKYFHKGSPMVVTGSIRTGSYENNEGNKVYTTDVLAESVEFVPRDKQNTEIDIQPTTIAKTIADLEPMTDNTEVPF